MDVLTVKLDRMARDYHCRGVILGGGVTANARLREEAVKRSPLPVFIPPPVSAPTTAP